MYLVFFLTIITVLSIIFGEFSHYPFGASGTAVSVTDLLLGITLIFLLIWKVGIKKDLKIPKIGLGLLIFWGVALISLLISGNLSGGLYLIRFIVYSSSFFLGFFLINSKVSNPYTLFKVITISGFVLTVLGFLQLFFVPDLSIFESFGFDPHINRLTSTLLDPNFMGALLNMFLLVTFVLWDKGGEKRYLILEVVFLLALILTFSRSAYLMLALEILIIGVARFRKLLLLVLVGVVALYLLFPRFSQRINGAFSLDKSASERLISWQNGLAVFKINPIFGIGFDNLRTVYSNQNLFKVFSRNGGHSGAGVDSSLIFLLATTGILGSGVFLFWNFYLLKKIYKTPFFLFWVTLLFGLLVDSQFINSWFYPSIMLLYYLILGLIVGSL